MSLGTYPRVFVYLPEYSRGTRVFCQGKLWVYFDIFLVLYWMEAKVMHTIFETPDCHDSEVGDIPVEYLPYPATIPIDLYLPRF